MDIISEKPCTKCGIIKPLDQFPRCKDFNSGYHSQCRDCKNQAMREYRQRHPGMASLYAQRWNAKNPEKHRKYQQRWNDKHKSELRAYHAEYYVAHREEKLAQGREYYQRIRYIRYQKNLESILKSRRHYYQKNKERVKLRVRQYKQENRQRYHFLDRRRNLRKLDNGGHHTINQWEALKCQYEYMCLCCHRFEPEITLTEDHVIPISKGGSDDIENIQPLCRECNSRKNANIIDYR